ncbi:PIN domain-containing protein [Candidatus Saccharibacteria bacterium]|nr:MAG: PIN domain-containing protein [Candidatus Saccharibacteria bacterium]
MAIARIYERVVIDTKIILRCLLQDSSTQSPEASRVILEAPKIIITDVVLMECAYVMSLLYKKTHQQIALSLGLFIKRNNVVYEAGLAEYYLGLYVLGSLDLADCYLVAYALKHNETLQTFDKKLQRVYEAERAKVA